MKAFKHQGHRCFIDIKRPGIERENGTSWMRELPLLVSRYTHVASRRLELFVCAHYSRTDYAVALPASTLEVFIMTFIVEYQLPYTCMALLCKGKDSHLAVSLIPKMSPPILVHQT